MSFKLFLIFMFLSSMLSGTIFVRAIHATLSWEDGRIQVDVYVIALGDVGVSGVGNVSRVIDGVDGAVNDVDDENYSVGWPTTMSGYGYYLNVSRYIHYDYGGGFQWTWLKTEFPVNATLHVVKDWETYRSIVENQHECIVIDCHGEIVPVPEGYSREAWTDKIAEAMLHRNLTWVHVAGYPFYYAWHEGANDKEAWGEAGFQQLTKHINKPNITIQHSSPDHNMAGLSRVEQYWMKTWPAMHEANEVSADYPLLDSDFDGYIALPIWSKYEEYNAGAVVAFKKTINDTSCGFYVHMGINQTYDVADNPTDADLYRGYMGCAGGLWSLVSRTARETLIREAESLIQKASDEGRLEGLKEARGFLESAKGRHSNYFEQGFLRYIYYAMLAAVKAERVEPNPLQLYIFIGLSVGSVAAIAAAVWRKRNKENDGDG